MTDFAATRETAACRRCLHGGVFTRVKSGTVTAGPRRRECIERATHCVVVVWQLDRRIRVAGRHAGQWPVWYAVLNSVNFSPFAVEITMTRSPSRMSPRPTSFSSAASATPVCGQLNMPVRSARADRVGELGLAGLLDDAVVALQRRESAL